MALSSLSACSSRAVLSAPRARTAAAPPLSGTAPLHARAVPARQQQQQGTAGGPTAARAKPGAAVVAAPSLLRRRFLGSERAAVSVSLRP
jgi:hypothetical protein